MPMIADRVFVGTRFPGKRLSRAKRIAAGLRPKSYVFDYHGSRSLCVEERTVAGSAPRSGVSVYSLHPTKGWQRLAGRARG